MRLIVTFTPGAINDLIARTLGVRLTEMWGQQVVVDSRAGGATIIGTELAARSAPDGHTLILFSIFHGINPSVHAKLPFDVLKDFASVSLIGTSPFVLVVHPSVLARNLKEFTALAKAKPEQLAYGSSGIGSAQHLMYEMLALMAGIRAVHVPYKGGAPMLNDVVAGRLQFTFMSYSTLGPQLNAGRARAP